MKGPIRQSEDRKNRVRKRRGVGRKDRNRNKYRIKRSGQAQLSMEGQCLQSLHNHVTETLEDCHVYSVSLLATPIRDVIVVTSQDETLLVIANVASSSSLVFRKFCVALNWATIPA